MNKQRIDKIILMAYAVSGLFYCLAAFFLLKAVPAGRSDQVPSVIINEVAWMGDLDDPNREWIELKNATEATVDLSGWTLVATDGTPKIELGGVIDPGGYFLLERTSDQSVASVTADQIYAGALGNGGEILELRDAVSQLIDQLVSSSSWPGGSNESKQTLARASDLSWQSSLEPGGTPRADNRLAVATSSEPSLPVDPAATSTQAVPNDQATTTASVATATAQAVVSGGSSAIRSSEAEVVINEFLPNPRGNDVAGEWIELYNFGYQQVDLSGWKVAVGEKQFVVSATGSRSSLLPPGGYMVLRRSETKLVLPNDRGQLFLFSPESAVPRQAVSYEAAAEGKSFARNDLGGWQWSEAVSEGQTNAIVAPNLPPEVDWSASSSALVGQAVLFDSSDTVDPEDDKLAFSWQFGDGATSSMASPEHVFARPGRYLAKLTVSDGRQSASKERYITVVEPKTVKPIVKPIAAAKASSSFLILTEAMPNPAGEDAEDEWIEVYNRGHEAVDLLNWQLDDAPGGSSPYRVQDSIRLLPGNYYIVSRADSRLALNNGGDEVRLFNALGELADETKFASAKEGWSYARDGQGHWSWTVLPTPGQSYQPPLKPQAKTKVATKKSPDKKVSGVKVAATAVKTSQRSVEGTVIALPGQLGKQVFYITSPEAWEIYSYRQDFPVLALGDRVRVRGETSQTKGVPRLKTKSRQDIAVLAHAAPPQPLALACNQLTPQHLGQLVSFKGEITKKTAALGYLDDGTAERAVAWAKLGTAALAPLKEGQTVSLAGVVEQAADSLRLVPRGPFDLVLPAAAAAAAELPLAALPNEIPQRRAVLEAGQYLQLLLVGLALVLVGWLINRRQRY